MAGEDQLTLSNGTIETMTIIPANGKLANGNGIHKDSDGKHKDNGSIVVNGKEIENVENGKLMPDEKSDLEIDDDETTCGWGSFRPKWLQLFATKQIFLVMFCLTWVLQGMYFTYFVSVITTIEKLFQIQSKTTGMIMSATEIGQISSALLLTYFAGQGHRPKWIAWGMILFAVSAMTCSLPHFIYGEVLIKQNELSFNGGTLSGEINGTSISSPVPANLCKFLDKLDNSSANEWSLATATRHQRTDTTEYCEGDFIKEQQTQSKMVTYVLITFFFSLLGVGMSQTAVNTLGIPYIDDNVASRETPLYFAITIGVKIIGPAMGFMLGSLCTMIYADLSVDPPITPSDPRWVGAWWLGLVIISSTLMLLTIVMFAFPTRLPKSKIPPRKTDAERPRLRDFPKAIKRLLKNDILLYRTASSVLHLLPIAGLYTFLPKYLESQFRLAAHNANMISGVGGILVMGLGVFISGFLTLKFKPNAKFVAGWIAFTAIAYAIGMGILMFVGCPMNDFTGLTTNNEGISHFKPICEATCDCDRERFSPICGADGRTYFSACHAGCSNYTVSEGKIVNFTDCQCIAKNHTMPEIGEAKTGYCPLECNNFYVYLILFSFIMFIHSTSEVGSMMLTLRCVECDQKAMALGLVQFAIGLFGNVPCPIVYGAVVDSACLVWEYACGEKGACWLYDTTVFRTFFHGTTAAIMATAFIFDLIVWYKAGSINVGEDEEHETGTAEEMANLKIQDAQTVENEYL